MTVSLEWTEVRELLKGEATTALSWHEGLAKWSDEGDPISDKLVELSCVSSNFEGDPSNEQDEVEERHVSITQASIQFKTEAPTAAVSQDAAHKLARHFSKSTVIARLYEAGIGLQGHAGRVIPLPYRARGGVIAAHAFELPISFFTVETSDNPVIPGTAVPVVPDAVIS